MNKITNLDLAFANSYTSKKQLGNFALDGSYHEIVPMSDRRLSIHFIVNQLGNANCLVAIAPLLVAEIQSGFEPGKLLFAANGPAVLSPAGTITPGASATATSVTSGLAKVIDYALDNENIISTGNIDPVTGNVNVPTQFSHSTDPTETSPSTDTNVVLPTFDVALTIGGFYPNDGNGNSWKLDLRNDGDIVRQGFCLKQLSGQCSVLVVEVLADDSAFNTYPLGTRSK